MGFHSGQAETRSVVSAIKAHYRDAWLTRSGAGYGSYHRLEDHLYEMTFQRAGCDVDELFEAFVEAIHAFERNRAGVPEQPHFGIAYLARRPDHDDGVIRAIVMLGPDSIENATGAAKFVPERKSGLSITKCEVDPDDPDAHWRWLADGIQASISLFAYCEARFVVIGRDKPFRFVA